MNKRQTAYNLIARVHTYPAVWWTQSQHVFGALSQANTWRGSPDLACKFGFDDQVLALAQEEYCRMMKL